MVTDGKTLWPFLTQQAQLGSQIQAGPGKFVCDGTEADGATTPPVFPLNSRGILSSMFFSQKIRIVAGSLRRQSSNLPSNLPLKSFALESEPLGRLNLPPFCPLSIVLWVGILERDSSLPGTSPAAKAAARTSLKEATGRAKLLQSLAAR